jgi:hypothetical protein
MCGIIASFRYVDGRILTFEKFKQKMDLEGFKGNVLNEWGTKESVLEDYKKSVKDGVLDKDILISLMTPKLKLDQGADVEAYILNKKEAITLKTQSFINRIDSQVPQDERSILTRDSLGTFLFAHSGWLTTALARRFKHRHNNLAEQSFQEGTYRTMGNFLYNVVQNPKGIMELYAELDSGQKSNIKRVLIEMAYANALGLVAMLLAGMVDDEEDPMYVIALADLIATRVAVEQIGSTTAIPYSIWKATSDPIMLKRKLEEWTAISGLADEEKGAVKYLRSIVPFMRDIQKFRDPTKARQSYEFFQEKETDLYDRFAPLTNFFQTDEE